MRKRTQSAALLIFLRYVLNGHLFNNLFTLMFCESKIISKKRLVTSRFLRKKFYWLKHQLKTLRLCKKKILSGEPPKQKKMFELI